MPRSLILAALFVSSACAGTYWPDELGGYQRKAMDIVIPQGNANLAEYGLDGVDRPNYGMFTVTAWQFKDVTGAYGAALELGGTRVGNYVVQCQGRCPKNIAALAEASLPHVSHGSLPNLGDYLPAKNLISHSERYILGPVGLAANAPEIPAPAALFDDGTEAELAHYRTSGGAVSVIVFSFATPSLARQQLPQFEKVTGAAVKRTGRLVAVAIGASPAKGQLLDAINYQGVVAADEQPPPKPLELKPESAGQMVLAILSLAGILLAFCLLSGLAVGGTLRLARRFGYSGAEGSMTTLHLEGK
jgi:hypothetical protein